MKLWFVNVRLTQIILNDVPLFAVKQNVLTITGFVCSSEGKAACPGHVKAEPGEQHTEDSPSEEKKPADPDPHTDLPDKSEGEHDVSAMEVEQSERGFANILCVCACRFDFH